MLNPKNVWTFNFWTYEIGWTCFFKDDVWTFFNLNYSFGGRCSNFFRANTCAPTQCSEHIFLTIDVQKKSFWTSIFEHDVQKLMFKLRFELTRTIFLNSFGAPWLTSARLWKILSENDQEGLLPIEYPWKYNEPHISRKRWA